MVPFAQLGLNPDKVAQLGINVLAIGGGFLVGQLVTGVVIWFIDRKLIGGHTGAPIKKAGAALGGIAAALLVALIVFGHGDGWTFMGGGGAGDANTPPGTSTGSGTTAAPDTAPAPAPTPRPAPPTQPLSPAFERVRVTVLGGDDVKDERFYLLDKEPEPKRIGEVRAALLAKKQAAERPVGLELRFAANNALPLGHSAVQRLTGWAQDHGFTVTFPADAP